MLVGIDIVIILEQFDFWDVLGVDGGRAQCSLVALLVGEVDGEGGVFATGGDGAVGQSCVLFEEGVEVGLVLHLNSYFIDGTLQLSEISILYLLVLFPGTYFLFVETVVHFGDGAGESSGALVQAFFTVAPVDLFTPLATQLVFLIDDGVLLGEGGGLGFQLVFYFPEALVVLMGLLLELLVALYFVLELVESGQVMQALIVVADFFQQLEVELSVCGHNQTNISTTLYSKINKQISVLNRKEGTKGCLIISHHPFIDYNLKITTMSIKQEPGFDKSRIADDKANNQNCNKINFSKQVIRIHRNQIGFNFLSPPIKSIFLKTLKDVADHNLLPDVFHRWKDPDHGPTRNLRIQFNDEDGKALIWKMQRCLLNLQSREREAQIRKDYEDLLEQEKKDKQSLHNILSKEEEAETWLVHQNDLPKKNKLLNDIKKLKEHLYQELLNLSKEIKVKKTALDQVAEKNSYHYGAPPMDAILTKTITKQVRTLIRQSILAIAETSHGIVPEGQLDDSLVYVVMEQAYQTKIMKKSRIIKLIGSSKYLQKVKQFNDLMAYRAMMSSSEKLSFGNLHCCHQCMKICPKQELKFCHTQIGPNQTNSYPSSDYFTYRKVHTEGDYFYRPTEQHILPYFIYNTTQNNHLKCNRAFCNDCVRLLQPERHKKVSCFYCRGQCGCPRCQKAVGIVKLIALDYKNDPRQKKKYHDLLGIFSEGYSIIEGKLPLRLQDSIDEAMLLQSIWQSCQRTSASLRVGSSMLRIQVRQVPVVLWDQMTLNEALAKMDHNGSYQQQSGSGLDMLPEEQEHRHKWREINQGHRY